MARPLERKNCIELCPKDRTHHLTDAVWMQPDRVGRPSTAQSTPYFLAARFRKLRELHSFREFDRIRRTNHIDLCQTFFVGLVIKWRHEGEDIMKYWSFLGVVISFSATIAAPLAAEEFWIKEKLQNCEIWSDTPLVDGDAITWSGQCVGGKASGNGLLIWTRGGEIYTRFDGDMSEGKLNGTGVVVEASEDGENYLVLTGEFKNGEPHGLVMGKSADNGFFVGQFDQGEMDGQILWVEADGSSFDGKFVDGIAQGKARTIGADGEIFDGEFKDNERHGAGKLVMADGGVYTGEFEQSAMSGYGRFDGPLGNSYVGGFTNDKPNGPGLFYSADGGSYQGIFKMG